MKQRGSILERLKALDTRAGRALLSYLGENPELRRKAREYLKTAHMGGHQITLDVDRDDHVVRGRVQGTKLFVTPSGWIDRRRQLIETAVVRDQKGYLMISDEPVIQISEDSPSVRTFRFASSELTVDLRTPEGRAFVANWKKAKRDFKAWSKLPCLLDDEELAELKLLDLCYKASLDLGLVKHQVRVDSDIHLRRVHMLESERTQMLEGDFSGRPDDGPQEIMADEDDPRIIINGTVTPARPTMRERHLDLKPGWNLRLDTKQLAKVFVEGEAVWISSEDPQWRQLDPGIKARAFTVLNLKPVRMEQGPKGKVSVVGVYGITKTIEPIGLTRRHLHGLIDSGQAAFQIVPYACRACSGAGMEKERDEQGQILLGPDNKPIMVPCEVCHGSGAGAPGWSLDRRLGYAVPARYGTVWKPFPCKKCGSQMFRIEEHTEACIGCGSEMWKNCAVFYFPVHLVNEAFECPQEATHIAIRAYGRLVKDLIHIRKRVVVNWESKHLDSNGDPTPAPWIHKRTPIGLTFTKKVQLGRQGKMWFGHLIPTLDALAAVQHKEPVRLSEVRVGSPEDVQKWLKTTERWRADMAEYKAVKKAEFEALKISSDNIRLVLGL